ncbi:MAG: hypothetical protein RLZ98_2724 [Pseudomonadota bacterium]|jgi:general L-amino acid transport system permease protein
MERQREDAGARGASNGLAVALRDQTVQGIFWQVLVVAIVLAVASYLYANTVHNIAERDIRTGYDFLEREAGFPIGESLISYSAASSYGRALLVGFLNTLHVSLIGLVLATLLGVFVGVGALSNNLLLAWLTAGYIHFMRNIPVLLQIILWYSILINDRFLPRPREVEPVLGVYFTQRGVYFPLPEWHPGWVGALIGLALGVIVAWFLSKWADRRKQETGERIAVGPWSVGLIVGLPLLAWLALGAPTGMQVPKAGAFNVTGGGRITPEFAAVLLGLTVYTSAFIGEIVRAGILSVPRGQIEAARALGLSDGVILRKITLPQAMRVIVPPLTNQYLNLIKNSSLAVAVGYPDLVSIAQSTINITGQAIEGVTIIMIVYLTTSLLTALIMNWYNARVRLVER